MSALIAFGALFLFGGAWAKMWTILPCPAVEPVKDFDISRFSGRWYDNARITRPSTPRLTCYSENFNRTEDDNIEIFMSYKDTSGVKHQVSAVSPIPNVSEPGKLTLSYGDPTRKLAFDYFILGTDYDSYAVGYNCKSGYNTGMSAWILTRDVNPSSAVLDKAYEVVKRNHIFEDEFWKTEHTNCE